MRVLSQGLLVDVEHPTLGALTMPGPPLRFFAGDGEETTRTEHAAPPLLDEDADSELSVIAALAQIGLTSTPTAG